MIRATADPTERAATRYRTIFISDLHLGTESCQAALLLDFLRQTDSEYLYLVGDIIDGWQLRRRWHWPHAHDDVLQSLIRKAREGTRVIFVPGNHDRMARQFGTLAFGGIRIETETIHVTATGRRLLVLHGDQFDGAVRHAPWLAWFGDRACASILELSRWLNDLRARFDLPCWSLARFLKLRVKNARIYIGRFEQALAAEARRKGVDGVVCGHIHKPAIRMVEGILYCNDGDWIDSMTALVEADDGQLSLVDWTGAIFQGGMRVPAASEPRPSLVRSAGAIPDYAPAPGD